MDCTCPHIMLGSERTENKNWNPRCNEHGMHSKWYSTPEQQEYFERQRTRSIEMQRIARERRKGNISKEAAQNIIKELDNMEDT